MYNVREFALENEKGQKYSMMDIDNACLLTQPSGLGYAYNTEYEQVGNTFVEKIRNIQQGAISGTVNFLNYDNFSNFVNFMEASKELKFAYKIPYQNRSSVEFYKNVSIESLGKTEMQTNGVISEPIVFNCTSLWYKENKTVYKVEPQSNEIRWDYKWDSKFADYDTRSLPYINNGHVEAPVEIKIDGHIINPIISLYVERELIQKVKVKVEIKQYEKFLYGTLENNFYIMREKADGTTESLFSLDNIDFENDNVLRIPKQKSCELKLNADNEIINAEVIIYPSYKII